MYQTAPHRPGAEAWLAMVRLLSITSTPIYVKAPTPQSFSTHCISRFHRLNEVIGVAINQSDSSEGSPYEDMGRRQQPHLS